MMSPVSWILIASVGLWFPSRPQVSPRRQRVGSGHARPPLTTVDSDVAAQAAQTHSRHTASSHAQHTHTHTQEHHKVRHKQAIELLSYQVLLSASCCCHLWGMCPSGCLNTYTAGFIIHQHLQKMCRHIKSLSHTHAHTHALIPTLKRRLLPNGVCLVVRVTERARRRDATDTQSLQGVSRTHTWGGGGFRYRYTIKINTRACRKKGTLVLGRRIVRVVGKIKRLSEKRHLSVTAAHQNIPVHVACSDGR